VSSAERKTGEQIDNFAKMLAGLQVRAFNQKISYFIILHQCERHSTLARRQKTGKVYKNTLISNQVT
jgi:hypothetical protein